MKLFPGKIWNMRKSVLMPEVTRWSVWTSVGFEDWTFSTYSTTKHPDFHLHHLLTCGVMLVKWNFCDRLVTRLGASVCPSWAQWRNTWIKLHLWVSSWPTKPGYLCICKQNESKGNQHYRIMWTISLENFVLLLGLRRKLGRIVINKNSWEKNKSLKLWWFLTGCKRWLVHCCWGQGGTLLFLKARDVIPVCTIPSLSRQFLSSFFLMVRQAAREVHACVKAPPSGVLISF